MRLAYVPLMLLTLAGFGFAASRVVLGGYTYGAVAAGILLVFIEYVRDRTEEKLTGALLMASLLSVLVLSIPLFWYIAPSAWVVWFGAIGLLIGLPARSLLRRLDHLPDIETSRWSFSITTGVVGALMAFNAFGLYRISMIVSDSLAGSGLETIPIVHAALAPLAFTAGTLVPSLEKRRWLQTVLPLVLVAIACAIARPIIGYVSVL